MFDLCVFFDDGEEYKNPDGLYAFSDVEIHDDIDYYYGNFGFKNESGEIVIPAQFLYASQFSNGYAVVCTKWKREEDWCGPAYDEFNYIDKTGRIIFEKGFAEAHDFNIYGVAAVWKNRDAENMCLIDKEGNEILGSSFFHIGQYNRPADRYYEFNHDPDTEEYWDPPLGLYDTKERKVLFPPKYADVEVINDDMFLVDEYTGKNPFDFQQKYIDSEGRPIFEHQIGKGFCTVTIPNKSNQSIVSISTYVLLPDDATAWKPINGKKYEEVRKYDVIDKRGEYLIPPKYKRIEDLSDCKYRCYPFETDEPIIITAKERASEQQ